MGKKNYSSAWLGDLEFTILLGFMVAGFAQTLFKPELSTWSLRALTSQSQVTTLCCCLASNRVQTGYQLLPAHVWWCFHNIFPIENVLCELQKAGQGPDQDSYFKLAWRLLNLCIAEFLFLCAHYGCIWKFCLLSFVRADYVQVGPCPSQPWPGFSPEGTRNYSRCYGWSFRAILDCTQECWRGNSSVFQLPMTWNLVCAR